MSTFLTPRRCRAALAAAVLPLALFLGACDLGTARSGVPAGAEPAPASAGTPAERFAACLRDRGIDAIVRADEVLVAAGDQDTSVSVGSASEPGKKASAEPRSGEKKAHTASDVDAARAICSSAVPDYHAPGHNQR